MSDQDTSRLPNGYTVGTFPLYEEQVKQLVDSHKNLQDHPTRLAIWYDKDDLRDIKLLEAMDDFPAYTEPQELFMTQFSSTSQFLIAAGGQLSLMLANPDELRQALDSNFPAIRVVIESFKRGQAEVLYYDESVKDIVERLKSES